MALRERSPEFIPPQPKNFPYVHLVDTHNIGLSDRQIQVFELAINGYKLDYIGHVLGISPKTVEHHLTGSSEYSEFLTQQTLLGSYGLIEKKIGKRIILPEVILFLIKNDMLFASSDQPTINSNTSLDLSYQVTPAEYEEFNLTPKQSDVFKFWVNGLTCKQIAKRLSWSLSKVENQLYGYNLKDNIASKGLLTNLENNIGFRPTQIEAIIYFWNKGMLRFNESVC